jgi:hypothetical protein
MLVEHLYKTPDFVNMSVPSRTDLPRKTEKSREKQKSALSQTMRTEVDFLNSFMKEESALKADFGQISGLLFFF